MKRTTLSWVAAVPPRAKRSLSRVQLVSRTGSKVGEICFGENKKPNDVSLANSQSGDGLGSRERRREIRWIRKTVLDRKSGGMLLLLLIQNSDGRDLEH